MERRSAVPLTWLATRPRWLPFLIVLVLLLGGMLAPAAVAAPLLLVLALLIGWLTYLAWPKLDSSGRLTRLLVLALVAYLLAARIAG